MTLVKGESICLYPNLDVGLGNVGREIWISFTKRTFVMGKYHVFISSYRHSDSHFTIKILQQLLPRLRLIYIKKHWIIVFSRYSVEL